MNPVSCNNIHHDVTDLVNHGMVKNTKTLISLEQNIIFVRIKKNSSLAPPMTHFERLPFHSRVNFNS